MENNIRAVLGNSETPRFPCCLQLGTSAAIKLSTGAQQFELAPDDGGFLEHYNVLYTVDGSTCELWLLRHVDKDGNSNRVCFQLRHWLCIHIIKTDFFQTTYVKLPRAESITSKTNRNVDARGRVIDTNVYLCGSKNRGGLVVAECKKNSTDQEYYNAVTVAHYFANSCGTAFNTTESDIGLSVVMKIGVSNGKFDLTVEGPEQHPPSALYYLFDQVIRTGTWKPTMCPHCASIQRGRMFWQSDSEDSDSVPVAARRGSHQNASSITNNGRFRDGNGNFIENNYMYFRRRR